MVELIHDDCMNVMSKYPDKFFELAIVDPPYNVGASDGMFGNKGKYVRRDLKHYSNHAETPGQEYFTELFRVSINQIIWGANYYPQFLNHSGWIVWDKLNEGSPLSDAELAYQSINKLVRLFRHKWSGFMKGTNGTDFIRVHPNQKPVGLYNYCLKNYAKPGDKILDTHLGSGSSAIAAHKLGFDFTGIEIDKDYFDAAMKRFKKETAMPLFDNV